MRYRVSSESLACIRRLRCERLQTHVVVSCLHKSRWTIDKCLQVLPMCERRLKASGDRILVENVATVIQRMSAFHRIMLHAQAKQDISIPGCPDKVGSGGTAFLYTSFSGEGEQPSTS